MQMSIKNYPVFMKLGFRTEERYKAQNVLVSLSMELSSHVDPELSDDLERALDYGKITGFLDDILEGQEYKLIETVVNKIGLSLIENFEPISKVDVKVEKTCLPQMVLKTGRVTIKKHFDRAKMEA